MGTSVSEEPAGCIFRVENSFILKILAADSFEIWHLYTKVHGATFQTIVFFTVTTVRTSYLTEYFFN
jgi:hypothetical protein